ncbi:MAG TPA: HEAT repeat domain-containing protein [Steroidobacteraceae bacterium]|nr:HEAT repeat domain-containing protein [Steroidobacteraceae bacterium]
MNRKLWSMGAAMALACAVAQQARSADLKLPADGWASWEVAAPEGTPFWCCWSSWDDSAASRQPCKLDERPNGFGTRRDQQTTDAVRVYARTTAGKLDRLQVLAAACQVQTKTPLTDIAGIAPDDSARWLVTQAKRDTVDQSTREPVVEQALAGLAMHRGDFAGKALADFAHNDARAEARKWAVFWLAMMRGEEGAEVTSSVMFTDKEPEVRKHAAFAMTQSKSPRVAPELIKLGNTDKDGDVRAQAWFWLAQSGSAGAETAILAAARKDAEDHVREQAVFALSQLPDERSTKALIAAAEDQSLPREQRKRAVFWLSQSEADEAQKYLETVLARVTH